MDMFLNKSKLSEKEKKKIYILWIMTYKMLKHPYVFYIK